MIARATTYEDNSIGLFFGQGFSPAWSPGPLVPWSLGPLVPGSPGPVVRTAVEPVGTPVAAGRAVAQARTAIQESAGPGTDGAGNTPAGYPAYRADCPGPASTDTASPDSRRE